MGRDRYLHGKDIFPYCSPSFHFLYFSLFFLLIFFPSFFLSSSFLHFILSFHFLLLFFLLLDIVTLLEKKKITFEDFV